MEQADKHYRSPGTFSLLGPLYNEQTCKYGHVLKPEDQQFFAGVNKNYQEFACPPNATTVILGGAMRITCEEKPMRVKARICRFEDFVQIAEKLKEVGKVKNHIKKIHFFKYNFPGAPRSYC